MLTFCQQAIIMEVITSKLVCVSTPNSGTCMHTDFYGSVYT